MVTVTHPRGTDGGGAGGAGELGGIGGGIRGGGVGLRRLRSRCYRHAQEGPGCIGGRDCALDVGCCRLCGGQVGRANEGGDGDGATGNGQGDVCTRHAVSGRGR
eukprot:3260593-Prymnesium_polylepis.1